MQLLLAWSLSDIAEWIKSTFSLLVDFVQFITAQFAAIFGVIKWTTVAGDVAAELIHVLPFDLGTLFMAMVAFSIVFVFFGRIK